MNWKLQLAGLAALAGGLSACHPKIAKPIEERQLDEIEVVSDEQIPEEEASPYNPSYARRNDLLHTKLDVRFDWSKQYLHGKATLRLKPIFFPTDSLRLDAKGFDLHKVVLVENSKETPLQYVYNDRKNIFIKLPKTYTAQDEYTVYIEYTAKPNELPIGGSAAITADKGLYFINPLKEDPNKPQQIWTQGETESSSCWFPTVDRPNERCTQEISITVEDRFKTLSNGLLKNQTKNGDGTRTDYWVMDLPHAPYLFMMAVGEFAVVKDDWNGMLLEYYVEPKYEKDAKAIFPYTGEMLSFFSERFGVKYPWSKYSQIITRDYVSGAMENTTAVIFGEFVQKTSRELLDGDEMNQGIVAHEMMHHWFGDLVTCESWANLPLNESFAAYSEYLWFEHKLGKDAADHHRQTETEGYIADFKFNGNRHPLIHYNYVDKEDMFDSHSYNKGAQILHMLRRYLGDAAYFQALKYYLQTYQYQAAEVHDLRLAFERVTGEDLNWFFNQWFFSKGHPKLKITKNYQGGNSGGVLQVTVEQLQNLDECPVFVLPFAIDVYTKDGAAPTRHRVKMTGQKQTFNLPVSQTPLWVNVDADRDLLAERDYELTSQEALFQYRNGKTYFDRSEALAFLQTYQKGMPEARAVYELALKDPYWELRRSAIDGIYLDEDKDKALIQQIEQMAQNDVRPNVRAAAFDKLGGLKKSNAATLARMAIEKDPSYMVLSSALTAVFRSEPKEALGIAKKMEKETSPTIVLMIAEVYSQSEDTQLAAYFETAWKNIDAYARITYFHYYSAYLQQFKDASFVRGQMDKIKGFALDKQNSQWGRYGAASALKDMRNYYFDKKGSEDLYKWTQEAIRQVIDNETDPIVKRLYGGKDWGK